MSLNPAFIAEFAVAGWLTEVPRDITDEVTDGTVQAAVDGSAWNDTLVAILFWSNSLDSLAGQQAAEVIQTVVREGVGGPGLSNQDEGGAMHQFNGEESAFMLNWPFVWAAIYGAVEEGNPPSHPDAYDDG